MAGSLPTLPITEVLDTLGEAVRQQPRVVLHAPPGAGKTTLVPLSLVESPWHTGRCLVLEPRRIAARAAAERMAELRDEPVGGTVGYTTGDGRSVSAATRVEVITEGVLVRRIQRDPALEGVTSVILDEFHERSIEADLALAFALEAQSALRPDLRLLVMSATLEAQRVADLLEDAAVVQSLGRSYPVTTVHRPVPSGRELPAGVARATVQALDEHEGDVLVFLPGRSEIERTVRELRGRVPEFDVRPLYGALPAEEQRRALRPGGDRRRIIVATDIAESSLTVPGVRIVVDGGYVRRPAFDPSSGMSRLVTTRVSAAAADQRRGRAGREGPGLCLRLWAGTEALVAHPAPAIAEEDLTATALEVAAWGTPVEDLALLDQPQPASWDAAEQVLADLGATTDDGSLTDHGRALVDLPLHPRLGHMVLTAPPAQRRTAVQVAALLGERDILQRRDTDLGLRLQALRGAPPGDVHRGGLARVIRGVRRIQRLVDRAGASAPSSAESAAPWPDRGDEVGRLVALAYPDRVAMARGERGSFVMAGGRGARLRDGDALAGEELIVIASLDRGAQEARVYLAAALDPASARDMASDVDVVRWGRRRPDADPDVIAERQLRYGAAVLSRTPLPDPPVDQVHRALLQGIAQEELRPLPWTASTTHLRDRLRHLNRVDPEAGWPAMDDETLIRELPEWLGPFLTTARRRADLQAIPLRDALLARAPHALQAQVSVHAPSRVEIPTGREVRLDYTGERPVLAVKLQELFGLDLTPTVGGEPVLVHLLSPAGRPLQVTDDLAGFWRGSYAAVRADMRGRYPKHPWPEDPLSARPTAKTKRRR
ncbi:ATP-dependent helicase HrpB [Euzebya tangerina]|uniref:ATP-dependent helicase HrpB n=1 Tax=Euzebya tangerina TaxID=591198 RepID=UPI00196B34DD|nr:ATP-dependent helicase HrpB [Euzebya tangerina]